ncbi:MAG: PIG-L deacetylase family protein [Methylobacter sp.]
MTANGLETLLVQQPILAIGAHPDDLALAASSLLRKAHNAYCVIVTTGAGRSGNTGLSELRRNEEITAMSTLGLTKEQLHFLGIADQDSHRRLDDIITLLVELMYKLRPGVVVSHDYEQGHPDHDIVAFAVAVAAHRLSIPCHVYPLYHRHNGAAILPFPRNARRSIDPSPGQAGTVDQIQNLVAQLFRRCPQGAVHYGKNTPRSGFASDYHVVPHYMLPADEVARDIYYAERMAERVGLNFGSVDFIGDRINEVNGAGTGHVMWDLTGEEVIDARPVLQGELKRLLGVS